jgi:hypothetical protein
MKEETEENQAAGELTELLEAWHGNVELSDERQQYWIDRVRRDPVLRRLVAGEVHLAGLTSAAQVGEPRWLRLEENLFGEAWERTDAEWEFESSVMTSVGRRELRSARPWFAAAAGLVIGLFGASVVWAFAAPKAVAMASTISAFVDGGFEQGTGMITSGLPTSYGIWSGDRAEFAPGGMGVEGRQSLRFVQAEREPALPDYGAASCDVYQLVDLRSLKSGGTSAEATLELSVRFRDGRENPGETVKCFARIYLFAGSPETLAAEWPLTQKEALASASGGFDSNGSTPLAWIPVTAKVLMPAQADFAVVHLVVHKPETRQGTAAVFGEQFADEVSLTLKTQPTLPVRVARP